uniref:Lipid-A-disaccharide synthase n=1 Tax=uncultured Akkermansia sp. TaxID=512294 RepID=A0A060CEB6_9BACT|nr:CAZy families GT19 protein [uncultured Akkermansia sp.]
MPKRVYVVAGELSGDAHGAGLLRGLVGGCRSWRCAGWAGRRWWRRSGAGAGVEDWVEEAAVMGVWEVLKRYGWFKERFAAMLEELKRFRPEVLLLID